MFEKFTDVAPVITKIISYLSIKDLVSLSKTSLLLRNFFEGYTSGWKQLYQILKRNNIDILNSEIQMEFLDDRALQKAVNLLSTLDPHNKQFSAAFKFSVLQNILPNKIKNEIAKIYKGVMPDFIYFESSIPFLLYFSAQLYFAPEKNGFSRNEDQILIAIYLMCLCLNNNAKNAATIFFAKLLIQFSCHMIDHYDDFIEKENNVSLLLTCREIIDVACQEFFKNNIPTFHLLNKGEVASLLNSFFDLAIDECQLKCTKKSPIFFLPAKWTTMFYYFAKLQLIFQFADIKLLPHFATGPIKTLLKREIESSKVYINSFDEDELRELKQLEDMKTQGLLQDGKEKFQEKVESQESMQIFPEFLIGSSFKDDIIANEFPPIFVEKHLEFFIFVSTKVHFYQLRDILGLGFLLECHEKTIPSKNATLLEVLDDYFTLYPRQNLSFYRLLCTIFSSCYKAGYLDEKLANNLIETKFLETIFFASSKQVTKWFSLEQLKNLFEYQYEGESYLFHFANLRSNQQIELLAYSCKSQELDIKRLMKIIENKVQSKKDAIYTSFFNHSNKTGALAHDAECCTFSTHKSLHIQ